MDFDIFISHASEDKGLVGPLAISLRDHGYKVWYDEFVLRVGDSLTERIDYGLANSVAGILVLSPAFIAKPWPRRELAGLTARQLNEATRLIPIWHGLQIGEVIRFSPPLADIKAMHSGDGVESLVRQLSSVVKSSSSPGSDHTIENAQDMLEHGDYDLAMKTAFVAFDRRVIKLIDWLRNCATLPADFRISQYPGAAWEAVASLQELGRLNVPAAVNLEFLRREMETSVGRWSHAAHMPATLDDAADVVSKVAALLRANPLHP